MMIRRTRRRVFAGISLSLLGLCVILAQHPTVRPYLPRITSATDPFLRSATRSTAYELSSTEWLEFPIPLSSKGLRLRTNAGLPHDAELPERRFDRRPGWTYRVRFRIVDRRDHVVFESPYEFRVQLSEYRDPDTDELFRSSFFADASLIPSRTQSMRLPWHGHELGPFRLQARLEQQSDDVRAVYLRAYSNEERPNCNQPYAWRRLSEQRRAALCRATIYDHDLITPEERYELLRWVWTPLAPDDGDDVHLRRQFIYTLEDVESAESDAPSPPTGIEVSPGHVAVVTLPSGYDRFRAEWELDHPLSPITQRPQMTLRWFDETSNQHESLVHELDDTCRSIPLRWRSGLLELSTSTATIVRLYGTANHQPVDFSTTATPTAQINPVHVATVPYLASAAQTLPMTMLPTSDSPPATSAEVSQRPLDHHTPGEFEVPTPASYLRVFLVEAGLPLEYDVAHIASLPTPFRLAVRQVATLATRKISEVGSRSDTVADSPSASQSQAFRWQLFDASDNVLREGTTEIQQPWSHYDRVATQLADDRVSEPEQLYFHLSPDVARVRIESLGGPLVATAYTQPPDLPKRTQVPVDYVRDSVVASGSRTWFLTTPRNLTTLSESGRVWSLRIQRRPPDYSADLAAGDYTWDSFQPNGLWTARSLLIPYNESGDVRSEAVGQLYYEIPHESEVPILLAEPSEFSWRHKLIYQRSDSSPSSVRVLLDGETWSEASLATQQGELPLPTPKTLSHSPLRRTRAADDQHNPTKPHATHRDSTPRRLKVQTATPLRVFLNGVTPPPDTPRYLKRMALRIQPEQSLTFPYQKRSADSESLTLSYFASHSSSVPHRLAVSVQAPASPLDSPLPAWTNRERIYDIQPSDVSVSLVMQDRDATVDAGNACYFSFDRDLPPGQYVIQVRLLTSHPGYVTLTRTTPGVAASLQAWTESNSDHD